MIYQQRANQEYLLQLNYDTGMAVGTHAFFSSVWRRCPCVYRQAVPNHFINSFNRERFFSWCRTPAVGRIYVRSEEASPGTMRAGSVPNVIDTPAIYKYFLTEGIECTALLNRTEMVAPDLTLLRDSLGIGMEWRHDDIVATLSMPNSGIGFHAGHEDGFIVQLCGSRLWKIWLPETAQGFRTKESIPSDNLGGIPRSIAPPILACRLDPGDMLYIPALFPHDGTTEEESVSVSIGWRGITPASVMRVIYGSTIDDLPTIKQNACEFFRLLPDPPHSEDSVIDFMLVEVMKTFQLLNPAAPSATTVRKALEQMLSTEAVECSNQA